MLLIACPHCARQYDATGLDTGREVRCFCGEVFRVKWPEKLSAGALCCTNCGGAVSVSDETCPYCQAAISEEDRRQTTLCPRCYTRIDDDSHHCRACGLDIVPQTLRPLPAKGECPRCQGGLRVRSLEAFDVVECGKCLGLWITPEAFERITVQAVDRGTATAQFVKVAGQSQARATESVRYIPCLVCTELMQRRQYTYRSRHSGIIIDSCKGHGVWLDRDEIEGIVDFVSKGGGPGAGTGHTPLDPRPFIVSDSRRGGGPRKTGTRTARGQDGNSVGDILTDVLAELAKSLFH